MDLSFNPDLLLALAVILILFFIIYTRMKDQSLRDSFEEIKDLFTGGSE